MLVCSGSLLASAAYPKQQSNDDDDFFYFTDKLNINNLYIQFKQNILLNEKYIQDIDNSTNTIL